VNKFAEIAAEITLMSNLDNNNLEFNLKAKKRIKTIRIGTLIFFLIETFLIIFYEFISSDTMLVTPKSEDTLNKENFYDAC
jgi:hypothetical protein